ncbi:MAG: DUF86 domain-containing protein [Phycisphaerales bacterium]
MSRDVRLVLGDIVEAGRRAIAYVSDMSLTEFRSDQRTIDAVVRTIEIMGEAAKNVPETIRTQLPNVPWRAICGMRDLLIHAYHGVDIDLVWDTATNQTPRVVAEIERWLTRSR